MEIPVKEDAGPGADAADTAVSSPRTARVTVKKTEKCREGGYQYTSKSIPVRLDLNQTVHNFCSHHGETMETPDVPAGGTTAWHVTVLGRQFNNGDHALKTLLGIGLKAAGTIEIKLVDLPPGYMLVPSQSRSGQFSWQHTESGMRYATLEMARSAVQSKKETSKMRVTVVKSGKRTRMEVDSRQSVHDFCIEQADDAAAAQLAPGASAAWELKVDDKDEVNNGDHGLVTLKELGVKHGSTIEVTSAELPAGFTMMESRSRPGQYSWMDSVSGVRYATLEVAWSFAVAAAAEDSQGTSVTIISVEKWDQSRAGAKVNLSMTVADFCSQHTDSMSRPSPAADAITAWLVAVKGKEFNNGDHAAMTLEQIGLAEGGSISISLCHDVPPGFALVESRSRKGQYSWLHLRSGMRYGSLALAVSESERRLDQDLARVQGEMKQNGAKVNIHHHLLAKRQGQRSSAKPEQELQLW